MTRYSALSLLYHGARRQRGWVPAWRNGQLGTRYDFIVIGGGGHGLATAYYLAKNHGARRVAVLEKGWIGGGNSGRNTSVLRSNYLYPESAALYDFALKLYEGLSRELNYNIMLSQRGLLLPLYTRHDIDLAQRSVNAMHVNGVESELLDRAEALRREPLLNASLETRYPIRGAILQERGGIARHDAVVWGYARAASALGVDIVQNCTVTGFDIRDGAIRGLDTTLGHVECGKAGIAVAGSSTTLATLAGFRLPIRSMALQAAVTEPLKPVLNSVVMAVHGPGIYASQSDKGEVVFGGALDLYTSYAQRGSISTLEGVVAGLLETFPTLSRVRLMRQWAGTVDVTPDSSPIIDETPVRNLFINCGWGTGGFKAIPAGGWAFAELMANGGHGPLSRPFGRGRFVSLDLIDEAGASGIAH